MSKQFTEYKGLDLPKVAEEILQEWETNNIFEKSITSREGNKPFVFFEGPPSANGLPGVHHVLARTIKDIFPRYKTMKGYQVKRKAGWDTHGLPVELGVEKELGITKEDIGKKITVEEYNEACKKALKHGYSVIKQLVREIFSFETKIKGIACTKVIKEPEPTPPTAHIEQAVMDQAPQSASMIEDVEIGGNASCVTNCDDPAPLDATNGVDITKEPMVAKAIEMFEARKVTVQSKI